MMKENSTDPHTPDKLLSLLSITSMYISSIETSEDADAILKDSLKSDFKTINDLLTSAVTGGVTTDKAGELQLSDSPIRLIVALTTLFQSPLNNASVVVCACKAAQYILPNIPTDIQQILVERLHTAIIRCISKYYSTSQEICCDLLQHVLPQLWKMNSSLCKNAITDPVFVELLTTKSVSVLLVDEKHVREALTYAVLISKHIEHWKAAIPDLELAGVHRTVRGIFRYYNVLSVEELCGILELLCCFVSHDTQNSAALARQYVSEDMHTHLLTIIQEFVLDLTVQELTWKLITLLCHNQKQFIDALEKEGLFHCASKLLMEQNAIQLIQYTVDFLATVSFGYRDVYYSAPGLVKLVAQLAQLVKNDILEEHYTLMACCTISELTSEIHSLYVEPILNLDVLKTLKQRALQCPEDYLIPCCETLNNLIAGISSDLIDNSDRVFHDNYLFYQSVLCNKSITSNPKLTEVILQSLYEFIDECPTDLFEETLYTKSFTEPLLSLLQTCEDSKVMYSISSLLNLFFSILYICSYENGPKLAYECDTHVVLAKAFTKPLTSSITEELLGIFLSVFMLYNDNETASALIDVSFHKTLIDLVNKFGHLQCQELASEYAQCILDITADKEFAKKLVSLSYVKDLIPMVLQNYDSLTFKACLVALGIFGSDVTAKLINEDELHLWLITYIREHTIDGSASVLTACCRLIHIWTSEDWVKEIFIDVGCTEVLFRLLKLRIDNSEIYESTLGSLTSIRYVALCYLQPFIHHDSVKTLCSIIRGSFSLKAKEYASKILVYICDREDGVCLVQSSGILEDLMDIIAVCTDENLVAQWKCIVEKLSVYTVAFPGDQQNDTTDGDVNHVIEENGDFPSHGTDNLQHRSPKLDPRIKACTAAKMPDDAFCVGRMFDSHNSICRSCNSKFVEMVMNVYDMSPRQYQHLIDNGWYRCGGIDMWRLSEHHNFKCCNWETRVDALKFDHTTSKSYRKVLRKMPSNINVKTLPAYFNKEAFDLYNSYHVSKHDKSMTSEHSYAEHVVYSPYRQQEGKGGIVYGTYHQEYYLGDKLAAVGVIDVVPYGVVSVYMWYDNSKEINKYSFGVYSALKEIEYVCSLATRNPDMKYYYLQGWNPQNKKLSYKANYNPVEFFCPCINTEWVPHISGVNEQIENKLKTLEAVNKPSHYTLVPSIPAHINAYDVGVIPYEAHHGPVDVTTIPVCLDLTQFNNADTHSFMTLGEAITLYQIKEYQVEIMKKRCKELVVALGQPLARQFYIVLKVCRQVP